MTDTSSSSVRRWLLTLRARDPHEAQRTATPLELFFDLVFVVAVAQAASSLHHAIAEGHSWSGAIGYSMVFFALWWAWMNWTWFASAFDNDDTLYRLVTFVQMFGALVVAAGVSEAFDGRFGVAVAGYVIMRLAQVSQWLRAARANPPLRATALRYAGGITLVQALWVARLAVQGTWSGVAFVVLVVAELAVPWWAERARITPWHPHHIAERYVLLTLIVLGEAVLASTQAVRSALAGGAGLGMLVAVGLSGFVVVCSMWWLYTARPAHRFLRGSREAFPWGYGHYFVFSSIAAFGAGLAALVDAETGRVEHPDRAVIAAAVAVPVVGFLLSVWAIHVRPQRPGALCSACFLTAALLAAATPLTAAPLELLAVILAATVVATQATRRDPASAGTREP